MGHFSFRQRREVGSIIMSSSSLTHSTLSLSLSLSLSRSLSRVRPWQLFPKQEKKNVCIFPPCEWGSNKEREKISGTFNGAAGEPFSKEFITLLHTCIKNIPFTFVARFLLSHRACVLFFIPGGGFTLQWHPLFYSRFTRRELKAWSRCKHGAIIFGSHAGPCSRFILFSLSLFSFKAW